MRLRTVFTPASDVTDALARAAWACRLRHVVLREDVDPEADFEAYARVLRAPGGWLATLHGPDGVHGSMLGRAVLRELEGRRVAVGLPEYNFVDPPHRAAGWNAFAGLGLGLRCFRGLWRHPRWIASPCYLPSHLAAAARCEPVWLLGHPATPAPERALMASLAQELAGDAFDPESGLIRLRTRPRDDAVRIPARERTRAALDRYLAVNPRWADGLAAFQMAPLGARALLGLSTERASGALRRALRR